MKTYIPKEGEIQKKWYVIDAKGKVLGHVAVEAARILRGKHKPSYTPFLDCGDNVIIVNASQIVLTGKKADAKMYYRHSGYKGGLKEIPFKVMLEKHPDRIMYEAIRGMLPHNRLGRKLSTHFRVYAGADHPHQAQQPQPYEVK